MGQATNDYSIPDSVKFQTLSDACKLAKPGNWCAKVDLQSAYRSVCIHPDNYSVTGLKWTFHNEKEPMNLFDSRLPLGRNVGPSHFHRLSQAIRRYMECRGMTGVMAYIDDFLLTASSKDECNKMLLSWIRLLRELGFNTSWKKVVGPTYKIRFLGWTLTREPAPCPYVRTNCSSTGNGYFSSRANGAQASSSYRA